MVRGAQRRPRAERRSGSSEGITLNVQDLINPNKHIVGDNLFTIE
jgi:hypothetical protein